jgi:hypothetical protein
MTLARDIESITQTFADYVQTFQTLDPRTTLPYFHVPCMFIPPQGVRVLATAADVEALLIQIMEGLKARGYARSEVPIRRTGTGAVGGNLHTAKN